MGFLHEFFINPFEEFYKYRELIFYQVKAEFKQKHFQRALGPLWWFFEPVLMAFIFIFLSSILFRSTFGEHQEIIIIMSVLIWRWFSRSLDNAPSLLATFQFELKKTNLPILPLIFSNVLVELMFFGFALIVIISGVLISGVHLTANIAYLPILVILQFVMIVGFVPYLAKYGVLFKDISQISWVFVSIWFYLSPGIYPEKLIPENFHWLYNMNPFATIFPAWRSILIDGTPPNMINLGIWFAVFIPIALFGLHTIKKSRAEFFKRL
ncbi:MAG: ABC transporter permease [Patescibacteria group bacterium]|nr:ABC transporter permease [Patescibacteria group bacterium]